MRQFIHKNIIACFNRRRHGTGRYLKGHEHKKARHHSQQYAAQQKHNKTPDGFYRFF